MTDAPEVRITGLAIEGRVWLGAPIERVFDALVTPEWLATWWGDDDAYTTQCWRIAPVEGSGWGCEIITRRGERHALGGRVLSVLRPRHLHLSWQPSWQPELGTEVRFELSEHAGGTQLELRHIGFQPDFTGLSTHAAGWPWVLAWLTEAVASSSRPGER
jgi:uncharacterized protein YndB with AHSA1/START domain